MINFNKAEFVTSYGLLSQIPPSERLEIAFAGRSNVGKSSMINKLFNRKGLARVSSVPGKTATINFYQTGDEVYFVDLPGYGYAKVAKSEKQRWSELIEGYFHDDRDIALVVQLIDMRHPPTKLDLQMIDFLIESEIPFLIVLTKADKLSKNQQAVRLEALQTELPYADQITMLPFSSETGMGVEELREILNEVALPDDDE
ncbi:ribosome biogenesis GTP-binding protein YsxC [[Clostridium] methylpentosum DSM 5476]|uniref:Probable GTP-binding protein EngB n=1 Tax=[Clostridium] methylpentosum DSM 5476 TaxID=537013 RepID=C0EJ56_9FIRM|nr:ribosome biogenesis GTP-binding protein YsxC [[Clostridium] methylpentosum DSM 5476]